MLGVAVALIVSRSGGGTVPTVVISMGGAMVAWVGGAIVAINS